MPALSDWVQYITAGLTVGCVYAAVGLGFVLVARVTNIYNFAQGAYVMLGAIVYAGETHAGMAQGVAVVVALAATVAAAVFQEWLTRSRRGAAGLNTAVASLGYAVVLEGFALWVWGRHPLSSPALTNGFTKMASAPVANQDFWVWGVTLAGVVLIGAGFRYTHVGRAMQATALNPMAARLAGISPRRMAMMAFAGAGLLGGMLGVVTAPVTLASYDSWLNVGLIGFIAAALGEFRYPVRVIIGGLGLGLLEAVAGGTLSSTYRELVVYAVLLVWILGRDLTTLDWRYLTLRRRRSPQASGRAAPAAVPATPAPGTGAADPTAGLWGRLRPATGTSAWPAVLVLAAVLVPVIWSGAQLQGAATVAVMGAIGATGLSLLMGQAGQLSLGQGVFYLISGYGFALLVSVHGVNVWVAAAVGVVLAGALGWVTGALTLRLRGLNLALITLTVDLAAITLVTQLQSVTGGSLGTSSIPNASDIPSLSIGGLNFGTPRSFYYLCLALLVVCLVVARNLSRSAIGRALTAAGADDEAAAASRVGATRLRLIAFTVSAVMGGVAGSLWASYLHYAAPASWDINLTIQLIVFVVVGGLGSIYGGAVGAAVVSAITYLVTSHMQSGSDFGSAVDLFISGGLMIVVLAVWPGGVVAGLGAGSLRRLIPGLRPAVASGGAAPSGGVTAAPGAPVAQPAGGTDPPFGGPAPRTAAGPGPALVEVEGLTRIFGGIRAVNDVSFCLRANEIVALIGPNGAGKSTVINMLSGSLAPSAGRITVAGSATRGMRIEHVARLGLARTFQTPRSFAGMTALESVMMALESGQRAPLSRALLRGPRTRRRERATRARAREMLGFVGLGEPERPMTLLTAGEQRLAEVARALAIDPVAVLFDEPAAGLNDDETAALGSVLLRLRDAGIAILLVEHDMSLVMSVADRVIVLDQGMVISTGTPATVSGDEKVRVAYLGTVEAAT